MTPQRERRGEPKRFCSGRCRMAAHRARGKPVLSVCTTDNACLMAAAAQLYLRPDMRVADVTYGRGVFWRKIDVSRFRFAGSDVRAMEGAAAVQADSAACHIGTVAWMRSCSTHPICTTLRWPAHDRSPLRQRRDDARPRS